MSRRIGLVVAVAGALIVAQSVVLWSATGRAGFTRYPAPAPAPAPGSAPANAPAGASAARDPLAALLAESGLEAETGPMPVVDDAFRFGLLPSGADRHAISLLTIAAPAALLTLLGAVIARRPRRTKP